MQLIVPTTPLTLASTNVDASGLAEWAVATSYTAGDQVKYTSGQPLPQHEFEALQNHSGQTPAIGGTAYWADLGATNQHKMFNGLNNSRTVADDESGDIVVSLTLTTRQTHLCLLGLRNVSAVTIVQNDGDDDVNEETIGLTRTFTPVGWWSWLFGDYVYANSLIYPLYGTYTAQTVTVTLTGAPTAECAQCLLGRAYYLGDTAQGAAPRIQSYSTFEPDEFGDYALVARQNSRRGAYTVWTDSRQIDRIYSLIETYESSLVVLDANNDPATRHDSLIAYGKIVDFQPGLKYQRMAFDIEIEGIN